MKSGNIRKRKAACSGARSGHLWAVQSAYPAQQQNNISYRHPFGEGGVKNSSKAKPNILFLLNHGSLRAL
jgi:hypothetical protein